MWSERPRRGKAGVASLCPPAPAPHRPPCRATYSRARGSLSSSLSVFASRTLWGESKEELRVVRWLEEEGQVGGPGAGGPGA